MVTRKFSRGDESVCFHGAVGYLVQYWKMVVSSIVTSDERRHFWCNYDLWASTKKLIWYWLSIYRTRLAYCGHNVGWYAQIPWNGILEVMDSTIYRLFPVTNWFTRVIMLPIQKVHASELFGDHCYRTFYLLWTVISMDVHMPHLRPHHPIDDDINTCHDSQ